MPIYSRTEERLRKREETLKRKQEVKEKLAKERVKRELTRRRLYAELYEPHPCKESLPDGSPCPRTAIPGGFVCMVHGGNLPAIQEAAKTRLLMLVEPALKVLRRAMASSDMEIALKAAVVCLDRSGFHAKAGLELRPADEDLTRMSKDQLLDRAKKVMERLKQVDQVLPPAPEEEPVDAIQVTDSPVPENEGTVH